MERENGHVTEVVSLMKGEWSCYDNVTGMEGEMSEGHVMSCQRVRVGQFKRGRIVMFLR